MYLVYVQFALAHTLTCIKSGSVASHVTVFSKKKILIDTCTCISSTSKAIFVCFIP